MHDFLLVKLLWRWYKEVGEWKHIWNDKYKKDNIDFNHFLNSNVDQGGSLIWKNAQKLKHIIRKGVKWKVGNGRRVLFWEDIWILDYPLV